MTTPAETPDAKAPDDNSCPHWNGAEPHSFVAQKAPSFPVFIRACSSCGRIDFGELARDLADAGYAVVPQSELDSLEASIGALWASLTAHQELVVAIVGRPGPSPEGPRGGDDADEAQTGAQDVPEEPCPDCGHDPDDDTLHREGCRRTGFASDDPRLELQFGPPWLPWREADEPTHPESEARL